MDLSSLLSNILGSSGDAGLPAPSNDPSVLGLLQQRLSSSNVNNGGSGDPELDQLNNNYQRNSQYARPGPYTTQLSPQNEAGFQNWVKGNNINYDQSWPPDQSMQDYDMRGYYQAMQNGDPVAVQAGNNHFPDQWKTPYHPTFSNISNYATPNAPSWQNNVLSDQNGNVIADERPQGANPLGSAGVQGLPGSPSGPSTQPPQASQGVLSTLQQMFGIPSAGAVPSVSQIAPSRFAEQANAGATYPVGLWGTLTGVTPPPTHDRQGRAIDPWGGLLQTPDRVADSLPDKFQGSSGQGWGLFAPQGN